jgi:hypothetical protein
MAEIWANTVTILGAILWVLPETRWRVAWMPPGTKGQFALLAALSALSTGVALSQGWLPAAAGQATLTVWALVQWWKKRPPRQRTPSKVAGRVRVSFDRAGLEVAPA